MSHDSEAEIEDQIQIEARKYNCMLLRNNSGALKDASGRPIRFGLGNDSKQRNEVLKSSDEIGITSIVITQEMVGQTIGVFTAIEVKKKGWKYKGDKREVAQLNFINMIKKYGGYAGFAASLDDLRKIIGR